MMDDRTAGLVLDVRFYGALTIRLTVEAAAWLKVPELALTVIA
jgi:hypothetical protein